MTTEPTLSPQMLPRLHGIGGDSDFYPCLMRCRYVLERITFTNQERFEGTELQIPPIIIIRAGVFKGNPQIHTIGVADEERLDDLDEDDLESVLFFELLGDEDLRSCDDKRLLAGLQPDDDVLVVFTSPSGQEDS